VVRLNNFGGTGRRGGETFKVKITEKWSEFRSRMLAVLLYILFGIFAKNIQNIRIFTNRGRPICWTRGGKNFKIFL